MKYDRILPDASMNLWYHWTGMTVSGSSRRNLFRTFEIVEKSYMEKSTLITSASKETNKQLQSLLLTFWTLSITRISTNRKHKTQLQDWNFKSYL
jgi:hypothetical protein